MSKQYDTIIIGAGMSGLAAGIRLAMFGHSVCIFEKHHIPGGLNSYYERGGRKLDVGLHAMTNFVQQGARGFPLTKLLKQLRISHPKFELSEQSFSRISFPNAQLKFTNDIEVLKAEVGRLFHDQKENFVKLIETVKNFDEVNLNNVHQSAKEKVSQIITNEKLREMIFAPLLVYGSAWERDMDFSQFAIMFKSIFLEGFARPKNGVRTIIGLLQNKFKELGGELRYSSKIESVDLEGQMATGVTLKNGEKIRAKKILSSIGLPETERLLSREASAPLGQMSFCEVIMFFDKKPKAFGLEDTIIFHNERESYLYRKPEEFCDFESAVLCFPNNFSVDDSDEGIVRMTFMANHELWGQFSKDEYSAKKKIVLEKAQELLKKYVPDFQATLLATDVFTPKTIERYTGHLNGTVYGSPLKKRDGRTDVKNLFICGTDQGFLGIVGAMLSGISMANLHCLMNSEVVGEV